MDLSDFDYPLPEERIAQRPLEDRAASRMLVVDRAARRWEDRTFREFPQFLRPGDCLVLNDSKVFPARLFGRRAGVHALPIGKKNPARKEYLKGRVEVLLVRPAPDDPKTWLALVHPGRKMRVGERIEFDEGLWAEITGRGTFGERTLRFDYPGDLFEKFNRIGHVPLPPYIKRADEAADRERYQTVFASNPGSVAAPTAGLHFTPEILEQCRAAGAEIAYVTLHVGLGTFQPVRTERVEEHRLHPEFFAISEENAAKLRAARRVVAVGTTSVRTIESAVRGAGLVGSSGETSLYIYPGFEFQVTGALLTNFHLPRSSLLLLVSAFAGRELILDAYRHAVASGYRFYSYGDCMLIL
ncbi:MAG TPA: tRNA preQ1(34) S-adenosylmethionine ribosyltransferase-isomerase QueA [Bryobacteraceae bacterium]|nr:tRNA preQ1(34) S-adenosylmethionine ribosyltransferase-isomerase QueA [Bryobacteraceae bacterium]HOQ44075.1 tRNA preQ1(34) S-adenosylmethionine ribosyltransferase-isomerase QueA [Bryobacteraceae bacterium]HPQ13936.1 tRNA preQ1(34) S-adenosylmethionine ribosyltransferase-isomerase QueA [Bryobacteraceae bacterium]HPU70393.1 tRNA preQ1(34) S-adenosylmethionine ribosyltransferase-isomerase QueA [Bryobacteraceae bacterium]